MVVFRGRLDIGNVSIFIRLDCDSLSLAQRGVEHLELPERGLTSGEVLYTYFTTSWIYFRN